MYDAEQFINIFNLNHEAKDQVSSDTIIEVAREQEISEYERIFLENSIKFELFKEVRDWTLFLNDCIATETGLSINQSRELLSLLGEIGLHYYYNRTINDSINEIVDFMPTIASNDTFNIYDYITLSAKLDSIYSELRSYHKNRIYTGTRKSGSKY